MVTYNLNNAKNTIAVYHAMISEKCWLLLQQILLNIWLLTQNTPKRLSMLWYHITYFNEWSHDLISMTDFTRPDLSDQCNMTSFQWQMPHGLVSLTLTLFLAEFVQEGLAGILVIFEWQLQQRPGLFPLLHKPHPWKKNNITWFIYLGEKFLNTRTIIWLHLYLGHPTCKSIFLFQIII